VAFYRDVIMRLAHLLPVVTVILGSSVAFSQGFGPQQVITTGAEGAISAYATDLDGDGDADVLSTSYYDDKIAWYENTDGLGSFGPQHVITTDADAARSVYATDLDGDGDADVLSASYWDDKIAWYENLGGGSFGPQQVITTSVGGGISVYAVDLDGDGDADVLSASYSDNKIAWYENLGGGAFGPQQVITLNANEAWSVYATDLDGDGDADVLSASSHDDKIAWYENTDGLGSFGPQQVITTDADAARSVYATDLDGDGDADVLSASYWDDKIAWYENLGGGSFGPQQVITTIAAGASSVYATDLDGDGDSDVLSASWFDDKIAWCENLGGGAFGPQQVISTDGDGPRSVYATDLDGDGDADVLAASYYDDKIAWYENLMNSPGTPDCFGDGGGTSCPCGNHAGPDQGCRNTTGVGCELSASGSRSVSSDDLVLRAVNALPGQPGLFFQGDGPINGGNGQVFGDGLRCCGTNVIRLQIVFPDSNGTASSTDSISGDGGVVPGDNRCYQFWYRDPAGGGACGAGFNLSNSYRVGWTI
jgi:hypothetical protein